MGTSGGLVAQLFEDGEIQAYVGNASDFVALGANEVALRNITPEDVGRIDGNPMAVLPDVLEEKREAIVGFLRAWTKAQYVGQVNREVVEQIARERVPEEWRNEDERRGRPRSGDREHGAGRPGADRRPAPRRLGNRARTCW